MAAWGTRRLRSGGPRTRIALATGAVLTAALTVSLAGALALSLAGSSAVSVAPAPVRPDTAPKAVAVNILAGRGVPVPAAVAPHRPARAARRGDLAALAFYRAHDPVRAAHVDEVVWTGPMLRVYTDLRAADADSRTAIALCETAAAYAEAQGHIPSVFVHAGRKAGFPVLANKMDAHDDCRLGRVP